MSKRRSLAVLVLLQLLFSCGSNESTSTTSGPFAPQSSTVAVVRPPGVVVPATGDVSSSTVAVVPPTAGPSVTDPLGSWALVNPPAGMRASYASEHDGRREIAYGTSTADLFDSPIVIVVTDADRLTHVIYDDAVAVDVNGRAAFLQDMQSDGRVFGSQVLWTDELGRLVSVEWREVDQDVLALAKNVVAASAAEWGLLLRSLAIETQIGTPTSDVSEVVVVDEGTGPDRYRLVALVPAGYPLAEEDRRQACYRLDLGDEVGTPRCDEHSWWGRSASNVFVYGRAPAGVEQVTVSQYDLNPPSTDRPTNGADDTSTVTATVQPTPGPPEGVYVAVAPVDWCFVVVSVAGVGGESLGPGGPLPGQPEQAGCIAE